MTKFNTIVLAGGGAKGMIQLGALHYYFNEKACENVKIFAGTSIGSVICLLLICGYTPLEIFYEVYDSDPIFGRNDIQSIKEIPRKIGVLSMKGFTEKLEKLVFAKFGKIPTLKELYDETGKTLIASLSNVTLMGVEYFSYKTHPFADCVKTVVMSCSIPGIFCKIGYGGNLYADGGLNDNFPIKHTMLTEEAGKILGIVINGTDTSVSDQTFFGYTYRIIFMPINANTEIRSDIQDKNITLIKMRWNGPSLPLTSSMATDGQLKMFKLGYQECEKFRIKIEEENSPKEKLIPSQSPRRTNVKNRRKN